MTHFLVKPESKLKSEQKHNKPWDIQVYLHNLWHEKMVTSSLYDDATIPHGWRCHCSSKTLFLSEERKR
jgi:hypothetical protein